MTKLTAAAATAVRSSGKAVRISALASVIALAAIGTALATTTTTTVRSASTQRYGRILENGKRHTLYVWCPGTSTACTSSHSASSWPPFTLHGKLVAASGSGVTRSKLTTRKLSNGEHQILYYGHPLFLYKGDQKPCTVHGEGRVSGNGTFFVVTTAGRPVVNPCYLGSGPSVCPPAPKPCGS